MPNSSVRSAQRRAPRGCAQGSCRSGSTGPSPRDERAKCLRMLSDEVIPAVREHGKNLGLRSPFQRQPGSAGSLRASAALLRRDYRECRNRAEMRGLAGWGRSHTSTGARRG